MSNYDSDDNDFFGDISPRTTAGYESSLSDDFFGDSVGVESWRMDDTINPDINIEDSTTTINGDVRTPPVVVPDQPNSDNHGSPTLPDEESFREGFDTLGDDEHDEYHTDADTAAPVPVVNPDNLSVTAARRLSDEQATLSRDIYRVNLVGTMISMLNTYKNDDNGMAARAVLSALDPDNNLIKLPEMAGCTALHGSPNVAIEGIELGGIVTALRNLWESLKNKVFRNSAPTSLDLISTTIAPAIASNDETVAVIASSLAATYATKQVTDEMVASATCDYDYVILTPKGVTAVTSVFGALHGLATRAVGEVLPTDTIGLKSYCDKVSKILDPAMKKFGIAQSMEGIVGRNISYGSVAQDLMHIPAGKTLSIAGYTTKKQVLDAAKLISEKCQMNTVAAVMSTFAENTVHQLATIAGTVTPDNKAQIDERMTVTKTAALFTLSVLDEVARQSVSELICSWSEAMTILPTCEKKTY